MRRRSHGGRAVANRRQGPRRGRYQGGTRAIAVCKPSRRSSRRQGGRRLALPDRDVRESPGSEIVSHENPDLGHVSATVATRPSVRWRSGRPRAPVGAPAPSIPCRRARRSPAWRRNEASRVVSAILSTRLLTSSRSRRPQVGRVRVRDPVRGGAPVPPSEPDPRSARCRSSAAAHRCSSAGSSFPITGARPPRARRSRAGTRPRFPRGCTEEHESSSAGPGTVA
jgi:hypothetical protein